MKNLPKPNQLKVFQSIIEHGSFRAAAKALHQTQPALTQSMNELEKLLGTSLLERGPRGVVPTEAGRLFEPRVQLVLKELERAVNEAKQLSTRSQGTIELGSSSLPFFTMLPSAIQRFHKRFPHVNINLREGHLSELLPALRGRKLDFAIAATSPETFLGSEFVEEPFFTSPFAVVARRGHPLATSTSLNQLKEAKWYLPTDKIGHLGELNRLLFPEDEGNNQMIIRGDTAAITLQMVMNADFLTLLPKEILQVPYLNQQLCIVPIEEQLPDAHYSFIYSKRLPLTMHARAMIDKLHKECKNYPWLTEDVL
ncbi:LysR family transcriptional regulator [Enterobacterales bacterium 8AC]|nr:LysR family transcriptional regulator [Enterobacterales bacterium 8AC]